jgi:hypothetical protein
VIIPATVAAGTAATYALSPLDVWSPVSSPVWSFDDGITATGPSVSHAFAAAGAHTVSVTATDALANATSATRIVTVTPPAAPDVTPPPPAGPPPPAACADCRPRLPLLGSTISYAAAVGKRYTVFTKLVVKPARAGTTIRLRCSGRGCPFTTRTRTVAKLTPRLDLTKLVRGAKLRSGAELQVRVTRGDRIGTMATFGVRDRRRPRRIARCLYPGDERPAACP